MGALNRLPIAQLAVIVGVVTAIAWIAVPGVVATVVSLASGGVLALRAMANSSGSKTSG